MIDGDNDVRTSSTQHHAMEQPFMIVPIEC